MPCVGWIGTGMVFTVAGGVLRTLGAIGTAEAAESDLTFVQMSDYHIGFKAGPYQDVAGALQAAIANAE